jgi:Flp pilus assembly CpaF family ATPase
MKIWYNNILDPSRYVVEVVGNRVRVGKSPDNDIVLNSPFIADEALILNKRDREWEVLALGLNHCVINDEEVQGGDRRVVNNGQTIKLFPFTLTVELEEQHETPRDVIRAELDEQVNRLIHTVHLGLLRQMDLDTDSDNARQQSDEYLLTLERHLEEIVRLNGLLERRKASTALVDHIAGQAVRGHLLSQLMASAKQAVPTVLQGAGHWSRLVSKVPEREEELETTSNYFAAQLGLQDLPHLSQRIAQVEAKFWAAWDEQTANIHEEFKQYLALRFLKKEIKDIVFGYGPLEDLLRTPLISEIMVVDRDHIYVEKSGVLENSGRRFVSDAVTQAIIERIVARVGRRIDKSAPLVDARLADGSRVNAVIPPLAVSGPCLTIRKFPQRKMLIDDLVEMGSLSRTVAEFLRAAVVARCNILISGGTGTGKTTLLNCLSDFIPDKERIITIEDTAELQLKKEHVVRMESKAANIEGAGAYTIRDLVKNALRMRPDRIVVGECRGPEALDMLQAMNTGHDGSLTTIHANTSEDVILRLEVLVQMAAPLPIESIHSQIASAIDLIVQLRRSHDGGRRVVQVTEVVGVDKEMGGLLMKDIFVTEEFGGTERLSPTGVLPTFMDRLIELGLIRLDTFYR